MDSKSQSKEGSLRNAGCTVAFGALFFLAGAGALVAPIKTRETLALFCAASLFLFVGTSVVIWGFVNAAKEKADAARRAANPGAPWRWREDWVRGRIATEGTALLYLSWFFAVFVTGFAVPLLANVLRTLASSPGRLLATSAIVVVAIAVLTVAIRATIRHLRFRRCVFLLEGEHGVPGDALRGRLEFNPPLQLRSELDIELRCRRVFSDADRGDDFLWDSTTTLDPAALPSGALGEIPIAIALPADALPSDEFGKPNASRLRWRLHVRGRTDRGPMTLEFPVPVYPAPTLASASAKSSLTRAGSAARFAPVAGAVSFSTTPGEPTDALRVAVAFRAAGLHWFPASAVNQGLARLEFPAARRAGLASLITVTAAVFLGTGVAFFVGKTHWALISVALFFGLCFAWAAWGVWFDGSTLTIEGDRVTVATHGAFRTRLTHLARGDIAHVEAKERMSSGDTTWSELVLVGRPVSECIDAPRAAEPFAARKLRYQIKNATAHAPARANELQGQLDRAPAFRITAGVGVRGAAQARVIADFLTAYLRGDAAS